MANTLKMLTSWLSNVHFTWMFILLVEYGLVHRVDCINCEMLFLFWSGFCMIESWVCRLSLCLACKPFPGLCVCTRTGWWCASVVAIRSLSLFTRNQTDRRSQISSLDSWRATHISGLLIILSQLPSCVKQVNYMVTVFIRKMLLFRLYICFHVLNVLFAWLFQQTLFPGWCANKKLCYSNLWLVTLHSCFQPASLNSPPHSPTHLQVKHMQALLMS